IRRYAHPKNGFCGRTRRQRFPCRPRESASERARTFHSCIGRYDSEFSLPNLGLPRERVFGLIGRQGPREKDKKGKEKREGNAAGAASKSRLRGGETKSQEDMVAHR